MRIIVLLTLIISLVAAGGWLVLNQKSSASLGLKQLLTQQKIEQAINDEDWDQAQHLLETMLRATPPTEKNPQTKVILKLTQTYLQQAKTSDNTHTDIALKKREQANKLYQVALKNTPEHIGLILAYSQFLLSDVNRYNEAITMLNRGLRNEPHHEKILTTLSTLYFNAAQAPTETRPAIINWLENWGRYYAKTALKYHPNLFNMRFKLALVEQKRALDPMEKTSTLHLIQAARQYCNALLIDPSHIQSRYNLGLSLVNMNAIEEGFTQLNAVKQRALNEDHVQQAQKLAIEIQRIHNSVFESNPGQHTNTQQLDPLLSECLSDHRLHVASASKNAQ